MPASRWLRSKPTSWSVSCEGCGERGKRVTTLGQVGGELARQLALQPRRLDKAVRAIARQLPVAAQGEPRYGAKGVGSIGDKGRVGDAGSRFTGVRGGTESVQCRTSRGVGLVQVWGKAASKFAHVRGGTERMQCSTALGLTSARSPCHAKCHATTRGECMRGGAFKHVAGKCQRGCLDEPSSHSPTPHPSPPNADA
eukprot:363261-Chlamydomonas_euryale.AAC.4